MVLVIFLSKWIESLPLLRVGLLLARSAVCVIVCFKGRFLNSNQERIVVLMGYEKMREQMDIMIDRLRDEKGMTLDEMEAMFVAGKVTMDLEADESRNATSA